MITLTELQKITLKELVKTSVLCDFYLAGGTALLIRYGHRFSEDFDFFLFPEKTFDSFSISRKIDEIGGQNKINVRWQYQSKDTLVFFICEGERCVKFSFFEYKYPLIEKPEWKDDLNIFIADDKDILCMKLVAVAQRGSKKDFFDVWFLMRKHSFTLKDTQELLKRKYENLDFSVVLKSLVYFEDAENESYEDIDPFWNNIKEFFKNEVRRYMSEFMNMK